MDWRQYLHIVDEKLANALKLLDKVLEQPKNEIDGLSK